MRVQNPAPPTILIIEDEEALVEALTIKLTSSGFRVLAGTRAEDAMQILDQEHGVALILLDLLLPGASGFDVLEGLKSNPATRHIPIIILSNLAQEEEIEKGKRLGAVDFIVKSDARLEEIVQRVRKVLKIVPAA